VLRTTITVTAAAIAAICGLAACGPVRMGSAAITGGQRISSTTLGDEVANLEQAYHASKSKIQLQFPASEAPQEVLSWLLRFRIRDELAVRNHVTVSAGQSQRALAAIAAQAQGGAAGLRNLAVANGLPPDMLPDLGRYQAIENVLVDRLDGGVLPKSNAGLSTLNAVLNREECLAAKSLNIQVNPRFGQMDYAQTDSVIPATSKLSAPVTPSPAPSPSPVLTPPC
jgi:hypothetical protein